MDWERRSLRLCAAVLICAVGLRLTASGAFAPVVQILQSKEAISFFLYLQTGRAVRLSEELPTLPAVSFTPEQITPAEEADAPVTFSASDAELVGVTYNCDYEPDLASLLTEPLEWDLTGDEPTVLILHSHTSECYTKSDGESYTESGSYRTLDENYNMLCLGALVAERLEEAGIGVIRDTEFHDYPSYNDSYANAAESTTKILEENPSIRLVLDLHRDAADTAYGQMVTECSIGSQTSAQLMMVVGTDDGGLYNPEWEENLALALKLQVLLEKENPGICRDLNLTYHRYNQQLGDYALLIEIGAAGNTLDEARLAAEKLAQAIIELKNGSVSLG